MSISRGAALAVALCAFGATAAAQDRFATWVVDFSPGPGTAPPFDDPQLALGGPRGCGLLCGTFDVVTLGVGGSLTLGFDVTITDGPGVDFVVYENGFQLADEQPPAVFAEVVFVEVSSNGLDWARFPVDYEGFYGPLAEYGATWYGAHDGMAGGVPTLADVVANSIDPFDPTVGGGTGFDLARLANHPQVLSGAVDLSAIHRVRLVDCEAGAHLDVEFEPIWDNGGPFGSADVDAVAVVNHTGNVNAHQPEVDLWTDPSGYLWLRIADPDGLADLDPFSLRISYDLVPLPLDLLFALGVTDVVTFTSDELLLRISASTGFTAVFATSIRDWSGNFSCDQVMLQI